MGAIMFLPSWAKVPAASEGVNVNADVAATAEMALSTASGNNTTAVKASTIVPAFDDWAEEAIGGVDPKVLKLALSAATCAVRSGAVDSPSTLTVIDYSKPSSERRMWVYELPTRKLLYEELVAHGRGSGENLATNFSNEPETYRTSIGLFVTAEPYVGRNGYSLRLDGLDKGYNDRARERAIVIHGAPYVNPQFVKSTGRLGRSHGCPAVREPIARDLIDRVKGGNLVFSYYPNQEWLRSSKYLGGCGE